MRLLQRPARAETLPWTYRQGPSQLTSEDLRTPEHRNGLEARTASHLAVLGLHTAYRGGSAARSELTWAQWLRRAIDGATMGQLPPEGAAPARGPPGHQQGGRAQAQAHDPLAVGPARLTSARSARGQ
eukprot:2943305-Alexandrium_andersonii.AAC.1